MVSNLSRSLHQEAAAFVGLPVSRHFGRGSHPTKPPLHKANRRTSGLPFNFCITLSLVSLLCPIRTETTWPAREPSQSPARKTKRLVKKHLERCLFSACSQYLQEDNQLFHCLPHNKVIQKDGRIVEALQNLRETS